MTIQQPAGTDKQNSPDHSLSHRVFANDDAAPAQSIVVDSGGDVKTTGKLYFGDATPMITGSGFNDGDAWIKGRTQIGSGIVSRANNWGSSLFTISSTGLGTTHLATATFDLTGGAYENLLTVTSWTGEWTFVPGDVGKIILIISGDHNGGVALISEYVSNTTVILDTCGWDADVDSAVSILMLDTHHSFTSPNLKINNIGATCKWKNVAIDHTGQYSTELNTSIAAAGVTNLRVETDSNGYSNSDSMQIKHITGNLAAGNIQKVIRVTIDDSLCTGGSTTEVEGLKFTRTRGNSTAHVDGVAIGTGFTNALHISGSPEEAIDYGYSFTALFAVTDRTTAFQGDGTNVQMFTADNTGILIGADTTFGVIKYVQSIAGSATITPTWQYSTGDGTWATLVVSDTTTGMRLSGKVAFTIPADWAKTTHCNGSTGVITSGYYVRITRTANTLVTPPTESYFGIFQNASETDTLIRGDGTIKPAQLADASAPNDSIYYSITASKLVYKDLAGTVRNLY